MTEIHIDNQNGHLRLSAQGHTDARECAVISSIFYNLKAYAENTKGVDIMYDKINSGNSEIIIRGRKGKEVYKFVEIGLMQLSYNNDNVKVIC